ncbi:MAG: glycosyl transferase [Paramuribaculum sp.]|nr:glycosyl transferase [Paramuribaculum sp.]
MIPKIIHYCWFGNNPMPPLALKCLESWKTFLPEYTVMVWNEETFDLNSHPFTKEAYEAKKYAFITDYVRLWALKEYGGVYMDTDVEVLKPLDKFLEFPAFSGFEDETHIPTGIMASEKGGKWVTEQLAYYDNRHFKKPDGSLDTTTNVTIMCENMSKQGFILKNSRQNFKNIIEIFPKDYFCPKSYKTGKIKLTSNTHTIHHFAGSWYTPWQRFKRFIKPYIYKLLAKND